MLYPHIEELVKYSKFLGVEHIAISTNGTISIDRYLNLIKCGVNDFSISLDAGCCSVGDVMSSGVCGAWDKAANAILKLSKETYVSVGVVFTENNADTAIETINFIDSLGPSDIRVIPSAQWNRAIESLKNLPNTTLDKYPILKYRIENMKSNRNIRDIEKDDYNRCPIALDDVAVCNGYHFPCIIYLREQGNPIGKMSPSMRHDREEWFLNHDTYRDRICRENCIDCVVDFNNKWKSFHENEYKFAETTR